MTNDLLRSSQAGAKSGSSRANSSASLSAALRLSRQTVYKPCLCCKCANAQHSDEVLDLQQSSANLRCKPGNLMDLLVVLTSAWSLKPELIPPFTTSWPLLPTRRLSGLQKVFKYTRCSFICFLENRSSLGSFPHLTVASWN